MAFVAIDRNGLIDLWMGQGSLSGSGPVQDPLIAGEATASVEDITDT